MLTAIQRRIGLGCALLLAIAMTVVGDDKSMVEAPKAGEPVPRDASHAGTARGEGVPEAPARIEVAKLTRVPPAAEGIDVFKAKSWSGPAMVRVTVVPPPAQPVAPPLPFQYVGRIEGRDGPTILLARDMESFSVRAGEPIDNDYRLESATDEGLTIVYVPLNERQTLELEPK
jgi:hypothetical protein